MIKTVYINSIEDVLPLITEQEYRPDLGRNRSLYLYRGMTDVNFKIETSLYRNCKEEKKSLEPCILNNFTKYGALEDPLIEKSVWRQMILGQHHGLPTRLLDWSQSPLIALHFATSEINLDEMDDHDCVIWRIDIKELHAMLPGRYKKVLADNQTSVFTVNMLSEVATNLDQYDEDMQDKAMVVVEPPSIDPRIVNQYSFFAIVPDAVNNIEEFFDKYTTNTVRYIINKDLRWRVRDMLDQQNISERIIYSGLDGLSKWLGRHYFVRYKDEYQDK